METRELTDADIMSGTMFETNEKGHTKFKYKLPSGKLLESEWVSEDQRKKARDPWLNAVDAAVAGEKEEQRALDKKAAAERKAGAIPAIVDAAGAPIQKPMYQPGPMVGPLVVQSDPVEHAKAMLVQTSEQLQLWVDKEAEAVSMVVKLTKQAARWEQVLSVLRT